MIFLLDVDEVLAEFIKSVKALAHEIIGKELVLEPGDWDIFGDMEPALRDELFKRIESPGFCANLGVCEGAQEGVRRLRSLGCNIYAVTSPWLDSPTWCHERAEWLSKHFGIEGKKVVFAHDKERVSGDFLLDDKPTTVMAWAAAYPESIPMLWGTEFNGQKAYADLKVNRLENWGEVIGVVLAEKRRRQQEKEWKIAEEWRQLLQTRYGND